MSSFGFLRIVLSALAIHLVFAVVPLRADPSSISSICESAAIIASRESDVPLDVLRAISLTETGRSRDGRLRPWPWTVNMEGVGKWFDNVDAAKRYVDQHFVAGARSFDVGCFQINYRWHGHAFASIDDMFDPMSNARYAAKFLSELHQEFGDWTRAAGAYHSRTPKFAQKYAKRFSRIRKNLPASDGFTNTSMAETLAPVTGDRDNRSQEHVNLFPLLQAGPVIGVASLVPDHANGARQLIDFGVGRPLVEVRR